MIVSAIIHAIAEAILDRIGTKTIFIAIQTTTPRQAAIKVIRSQLLGIKTWFMVI